MTSETSPELARLTPYELYARGGRMFDEYTVMDGVEDYVQLHPGADPAAVRAEIEAGEIDPNNGATPTSIAAVFAARRAHAAT
jgi:hypothetical protein